MADKYYTWQIRINPETARKAREAAEHEGTTIGKWLTRVIEIGVTLPPYPFTIVPVMEPGEKNAAEGAGLDEQLVGAQLARNAVENLSAEVMLTRAHVGAVPGPGYRVTHVDEAVEPEQPKKARKPRKVCAHGTGKGEHCWQCGGKAVVA